MKNLNFELQENEEIQTIYASLNGKEIGSIEISSFSDEVAHIEHVKIDREYRGKGLYKMMLLAIFNLCDYSRIVSDSRNEYSQPVYEHWLNSGFGDSDVVEITVENEKLFFELS